MSKSVITACVIIPPKEKWELIQKIRRKYDRKINRWMPHINLLYPFKPEYQFNTIIKDLTSICQKIEPFTISLKEFNYFPHRYQSYTIWLNPEPNDEIIDLQRNLLKVVPECNDVNLFKGGYQPHLSVGQFTTYNIHKKIEKLQNNWNGLTFEVKFIYLISRANRKDSSFVVKHKIPLKGS